MAATHMNHITLLMSLPVLPIMQVAVILSLKAGDRITNFTFTMRCTPSQPGSGGDLPI